MGSLITYSAIAAKLAAMRGHFLTDDEFSVLAGMENVPAAVEYLKSSPAYRDVFSGVENEELHRSKIEELLWHSSTVISQGCSDSQTEPRENFWISTFSISRSMS